ncbi:MAG TPA: ABC transporter permease subunit [Allosphingosinicella sp.]|jgi:ABC-type transport system involved in multi-copper enzyme maturation permease subunit
MNGLTALARKAWLETRARFLVGAAAVVGVAGFMTLMRPEIAAQWRRDLVEHPEWQNPIWFDQVLNDYSFYLWHYLYQDMLQKVLVVFAVLLGVGGLTREAQYGTAGFTLGLPLRRPTVIGVRAAVSAGQLTLLALAAVATIMVGSSIVGEPYPAGHALLHGALMLLGALVALAASLAVSAAIEGEHAPMLIGLSAVSLLYFLAAPYSDGGPEPPVVRALNLPGVMAGGPGAGTADIRWAGVAVAAALAALAFGFACKRSMRRDY